MSGVTEDLSVACHAAARRFDPAFKLFGSTIPVSSLRDCKTMTDGKWKEEESMVVFVEDSYTRSCSQVVGDDAPESELGSSSGSNDGCDEVKPNSGIERTAAPVPSAEYGAPVNCGDTQKCLDDDHGDATQGKVRKKPGKPVPCPRCDSLDTKFCYYNNYNVNQPRHFCKNCQRYWTAGGSLRNVPVGAGRRKNKHSTTAFPDSLVARDDEPDAAHQLFSCSESSFVGVNRQMKVLTPPSRLHALPLDVSSLAASDGPSSSVILNFGQQESLLCESIGATSSNVHRSELLHELGRVSGRVCVRAERNSCSSGLSEAESNLLYEKQIQLQDDRSCAADMSNKADATIGLQPFGKPCVRSTVTAQPVEPLSVESKMDSTIRTEVPTNANTSLGWAPGGPFAFVSGQWQHVGNIGWSNIALPAMATDLNPSSNIISANHPQSKASVNHPPWSVALGSPWLGIPGSVIQNPTWGPHACSGAWTVPWAPAAAAAAATNPICGSLTLGKHPREQEEPADETQGSLWVPKTLRIHDLEEAGRSSIWTTLVLGNKTESLTSGGIFRAFQPKAECIESDYPHVQARHSNPAALTRSMAFQECILTSQDADAQGKH